MLEEATPSENGQRSYSTYLTDPMHDLVVSAMRTNNARHWALVTKALGANLLMTTSITSAVELLASQFERLPATVQRRLARMGATLSGMQNPMNRDTLPPARLALQIAAGVHPEPEVIGQLLELKARDPLGFVRLLGFWHRPGIVDFLKLLLVDPEPEVRRHAAYYLMTAVERGDATEHDADVAITAALAVDQGCAMASGLAQAFRDMPARAGAASQLASNHISSIVRAFEQRTS